MSIAEKDLELITGRVEIKTETPVQTSWLIVQDDETYEMAQGFKSDLNKIIAEIKDYFKPRKAASSAVHKDIVQMEKDALSPYDREKGSLQGKQNAYLAKIDKERREAEAKLRASVPEEIADSMAMFIPPAPKVKGSRTTFSGEITDANLFLGWLIKNNSAELYIDFKTSALNNLAKTKQEVPGFKAVKHVSAV